jgi:hypothetical protein
MLTPPLEFSYVPNAGIVHPLRTRDINYVCDYPVIVDKISVDGGDDDSLSFPLTAFSCIALQPLLSCINQPKALTAKKVITQLLLVRFM